MITKPKLKPIRGHVKGEHDGYWTVVMFDTRTAGNTTTFANVSIAKK